MNYKFHIKLHKTCFCTMIVISIILCMPDFAHTQALEQLRSEKLFDEGLEYYKQQKLNEAIEKFNQAINLDNNYDSAYYMRGLTYYDKGNLSEATKNIRQAIQINSDVWLSILNTHRNPDYIGAKQKYKILWKRYLQEHKINLLKEAEHLFWLAEKNTQGQEQKMAQECLKDVRALIKKINVTSFQDPSGPSKNCVS